MKRSSLTVEQIAPELGITTRTLRNKLNGVTEFNRGEMYRLRDLFFPKLGVEYLFFIEPKIPTLEESATEFLEQ